MGAGSSINSAARDENERKSRKSRSVTLHSVDPDSDDVISGTDGRVLSSTKKSLVVPEETNPTADLAHNQVIKEPLKVSPRKGKEPAIKHIGGEFELRLAPPRLSQHIEHELTEIGEESDVKRDEGLQIKLHELMERHQVHCGLIDSTPCRGIQCGGTCNKCAEIIGTAAEVCRVTLHPRERSHICYIFSSPDRMMNRFRRATVCESIAHATICPCLLWPLNIFR